MHNGEKAIRRSYLLYDSNYITVCKKVKLKSKNISGCLWSGEGVEERIKWSTGDFCDTETIFYNVVINGGHMALCTCQNPQNCTEQRVSPNKNMDFSS